MQIGDTHTLFRHTLRRRGNTRQHNHTTHVSPATAANLAGRGSTRLGSAFDLRPARGEEPLMEVRTLGRSPLGHMTQIQTHFKGRSHNKGVK